MKNFIPLIGLLLIFGIVLAQEEEVAPFISQYEQSLEQGDEAAAAQLALQIGEWYEDNLKLADAKRYFNIALGHAEETKNDILEANIYNKLGEVNLQLANSGLFDDTDREDLLKETVKFSKKAVNIYAKSQMKESEWHIRSFMAGGEALVEIHDYKKAEEPLLKAYRISHSLKKWRYSMKASELLIAVYTALRNDSKVKFYRGSYDNYKAMYEAQDVVEAQTEQIQKLDQESKIKTQALEEQSLRLENERLRAQQVEEELYQEQLRNQLLIGGGAVIGILLLITLVSFVYARRANKKLTKQKREIESKNELLQKQGKALQLAKDKSDELLLNILPKSIAEELKEKGKVAPLYYPKVTILFTDFKGFTKIAANMSPKEIIGQLGQLFRRFDEIVKAHGLEKIKTIGDGYMAAGGVPISPDKPEKLAENAIMAAIEMQKVMRQYQIARQKQNKPSFELRIGIHTGPVVAGVIGAHKWAYDIWGDAVNLASRMESSGAAGKVNISGETRELVKNPGNLFFNYRGKINAKNKGEVDMYFVEEIKSTKSITS
ncbi:MAG TPA: hypothetical protein DDY13_08305 [Cytophagales bacterium]|jgi:adenylate cyclase|nr:hypothetical protein [Cytophagales bacterium]